MKIIYTNDPLPDVFTKSIFLAGPTPRSEDVESWRPGAIQDLESLGYDGVVFSPEWEDGPRGPKTGSYEGQAQWEADAMNMSDIIIFWVPRNMKDMPALTTNHEHGEWFRSGKVMLGYPHDAPHMSYLKYKADEESVPVRSSIGSLLTLANDQLGDGHIRRSGDRMIPLYIWKTPIFQAWYISLLKENITIKRAKLDWVYRTGKHKMTVSAFALNVDLCEVIDGANIETTKEIILTDSEASKTHDWDMLLVELDQ